jgi:phosphatidylinositol glycan class B
LLTDDTSTTNNESQDAANHLIENFEDQKPFKRFLDKLNEKKITKKLPLIAILVASMIIRFVAAWFSEGFVHPDEVFQSIEMVHFWIYGEYGTGSTIPWEYDEAHQYGGARSWFFVLILVAVFRFMMLLGATDPLVLFFIARFTLAMFSMMTVIIAYLFGKEIFDERVGLVSALLCGVWWFFPFWASRTMTDSISSDLLFLSIFLIYKSFKMGNKIKKRFLYTFFSGIVIGISFMLRFPSGLMSIPLFVFLLIQAIIEIRSNRKESKDKSFKKIMSFLLPVIGFTLGGSLMILTQGILDLVTWGDFLQSPINFFMYNIVEGKSAYHGVAPWYQYFRGFFTDFGLYYLPILLVFFIIGLSFKEKLKTKGFIGTLIVFWIVLFSALAHKEFRFIFIVLPLCFIFISNGILKFVDLIEKKPYKQIAFGIILTIFCTSSVLIATVHKNWMWDYNSGICNAMWYVGKQEDSERVVVFETVWYTGGYAYLDKDIPIYFIKINPWTVSELYNSTYLRSVYEANGTYCVVRQDEMHYISSILENLGLNINATFVENLRTVYVYN